MSVPFFKSVKANVQLERITINGRASYKPMKFKRKRHTQKISLTLNKEYCRVGHIKHRMLGHADKFTMGKHKSELRLIRLAEKITDREKRSELRKHFMSTCRYTCWSFCGMSGSTSPDCGDWVPHAFRPITQYNLYW